MKGFILVAAASFAGIIASADVASAMPIAPGSSDTITAQKIDWHNRGYRYHNYHGGYRGDYRGGYYPQYGYHHRHHGPIRRLLHHL